MNKSIATLICLAMLCGTSLTVAEADDELRQTMTSQGKGIKRGRTGDGLTRFDEYGALVTEGDRSGKTATLGTRKSVGTAAQAANTDFWFYYVDVELFGDFDRDGYFHGIDLLFDADTYYTVADVYAVVYLSYEYGPWNEYAVTEDFTLLGSSASDEYIIETELVSGYPAGSYDILIELFDASNDMFVASIGPDETPELALLPLEDMSRDTPPGTTTQVVVNSGGGGGVGWLLLLGLLAVRMTFRPQAARPSK